MHSRVPLPVILLAVLLTAWPTRVFSADTPVMDTPANVLVIQSYHEGFGWTQEILRGIRSVFDSGAKRPNIMVEFMDTDRLDTRGYLTALRRFLRIKYLGRRPDVIIACDDSAFEFALMERKGYRALFEDVPLVFCGINRFRASMLQGHTGVTGVVEHNTLRGNIDLILRMLPKTERIQLLVDDTDFSAVYLEQARGMASEYSGRVSLEPLLTDQGDALPLPALAERLASLGDGDVVLFVSYQRDPEGNVWAQDIILPRLTSLIPVPFFSLQAGSSGLGPVGGRILTGFEQGRSAAGMARRILMGTPVGSIPVSLYGRTTDRFDYSRLKHYGIDEKRLPEDAVIINRPVSFYARNHELFWVMAGSTLLLSAAVAWLLFSIARRRRAERAMRESERRTALVQRMTGIGIWDWDADSDVVFMSDNIRTLHGLPDGNAALPMTACFDRIHADDRRRVEEAFQSCLRGEGEFSLEYRVVRDGSLRWVQNLGNLFREGPDSSGRLLGVLRDVTDEVSISEAVRESEERLQLAMEAANEGLWDLYPKTGHAYYSPRWFSMLGYDVDAFPSHYSTWLELLHIEDRDRAVDTVTRYSALGGRGGKSYVSEFRMRKSDGSYLWILGKGKAVSWDSEGRVERIVGTHTDISRLKEVEESLRRQHEFVRVTLDSMPVGVAIHDTSTGALRYMNPKFGEIYGCSPGEVLTSGAFYEKVFPDRVLRDAFREAVDKAVLRGDPELMRFENVPIDNARVSGRYVSSTNIPIAEQDLLISTVMDVTERVVAERGVRETSRYLDSLIDSLASMVVGLDSRGFITHWNREAELLTGVNRESARGTTLLDVAPDVGRVVARLCEGEAGEAQDMERMEMLSAGRRLVLDVNVLPLEDKARAETGFSRRKDGSPVSWADFRDAARGEEVRERMGTVVRVDDVTAAVKMQGMMIQTEKMISVGGLAAGMAHEINNPLGAVLQSVQNIQRRLDPSFPANANAAAKVGVDFARMREYLEQRGIYRFLEGIRDAGGRAAAIVSNMLEFSRRSDTDFHPVSLEDVFRRSLELARKDFDLSRHYDFSRVDVRLELPVEGLPPVPCAGTEVEQVLFNLLKNAAQAMGSMEDPPAEPRITLRAAVENGFAVVDVEDNGPGMDEHVRSRVFEPFFTTKPVGEGIGLGLSVAYFIITNNHGGTFTVESEPGYGTRFSLRLPLEHESGKAFAVGG